MSRPFRTAPMKDGIRYDDKGQPTDPEKSGETFPNGWGCPCCDGTGFVSDETADRLRSKGSFPPDRLSEVQSDDCPDTPSGGAA